jgi:predicted RNA-binding protein
MFECYDHEWSREMTSAARKITETETLEKYVECHIFIVSNLWPNLRMNDQVLRVFNGFYKQIYSQPKLF